MPMARSSSIHSTAASVAVVNHTNGNSNHVDATDAGDPDGDGDDRTYCFCDGVSYGEMIACDDDNCEREWVNFFFLVLFWLLV
jgi:inhibitor of growth protein 3